MPLQAYLRGRLKDSANPAGAKNQTEGKRAVSVDPDLPERPFSKHLLNQAVDSRSRRARLS
ncbi:hypothetical protein CEF21_11640 [Bacillus sp. FJAT-42376]|nr:hypothetical protein CEF21_11640 [Bacillus sp. FJAT-42376]